MLGKTIFRRNQLIADLFARIHFFGEKLGSGMQRMRDICKSENAPLKKGLMQELLTKGIGHKDFMHTEIGRIPKEWEVVRLGEVCTQRNEIIFAHR